MEPPINPPTLEYATPEEKPVVPTHPVVGILGFLLYGGLFLLFSVGEIMMGYNIFRRGVSIQVFTAPMAVYSLMWALFLWRAVAALRGAIQGRRKP